MAFIKILLGLIIFPIPPMIFKNPDFDGRKKCKVCRRVKGKQVLCGAMKDVAEGIKYDIEQMEKDKKAVLAL